MTSYPPPSDPASWSPTGGPPGAVSSEERNWAIAAHVGCFVAALVAFPVFAPLLVLLVKGNSSAFIRRHAVESLNFQITTIIVGVVGFVLVFVLIGFVVWFVWFVLCLIWIILATVRASNGEEYRYPISIRLVS